MIFVTTQQCSALQRRKEEDKKMKNITYYLKTFNVIFPPVLRQH
jgi:hypothetical protein